MSRLGLTAIIGSGVRRASWILLFCGIILVVLLPRHTQGLLTRLGIPIAEFMAIPIEALAELDHHLREVWNRYIALQGVYEQNKMLRHKVEQLQGHVTQLQEQAILSEQATQLLNFQQFAPMKTVAARIIGHNATNWYRALIIDKGEQQGIKPEMGVITPAGIVGRVIKTTPSTGIVLLITDPNVAVTGLVQRTRDEGIIQGTPQGSVHMKYIPPLSPVQVNDIVVTSGLTGNFPRGFLVGHIHRLVKGDTDLFQSAEIQPSVDFSKLEAVLVITSSDLKPGSLSLDPSRQKMAIQ